MAKSSYEIRMNYKRAVEQANTLEQIAADMRNSVEKDLQECINEISCNWVGNNANAYMAKCQRLGESVRGTAGESEENGRYNPQNCPKYIYG